jgi:hypothetical protein
METANIGKGFMGIQYDDRAKKNKYVGYYWDRLLKRKVTVGCFETREDAQEAVKRAIELVNLDRNEANLVSDIPANTQRFRELNDRDYSNRPTVKEEKKPVDLRFGRWK